MVQQSSKLAQDRTASVMRIELPATEEPFATAPRTRFQPIVKASPDVPVSFIDQRLSFPRPPDLYLHHRAFLI